MGNDSRINKLENEMNKRKPEIKYTYRVDWSTDPKPSTDPNEIVIEWEDDEPRPIRTRPLTTDD